MTTRIADDYPGIKARMAEIDRDRKVLRYAPPEGVTIVLTPPDKLPDGLCFLLQVDTLRLLLLHRRNTEPSMQVIEQFFQHLRQHFPSAKVRTSSEFILSIDDTNMLARLLR